MSKVRKKGEARASPLGGGAGEQKVRVNVCVRVRPMNKLELQTKQVEAWGVDGKEIFQTFTPWDKAPRGPKGRAKDSPSFKFDKIFLPDETNADVHDETGSKVIEYVMKGYNGCIFAYGQTSAGKTHTVHGSEYDPGILPRGLEMIFRYIEENPDQVFVLRVSFFEIYKEIVNDLLEPENANLRVREDRKRGVFVQGLKEQPVMNPDQVLALLSAGQSLRHTGATNYNEQSSRSHTVFRLVVEAGARSRGSRIRRSVLNIIDLAGSENAVKAGKAARIKETGYINKSLLTLGQVIMKLSEGRKGGYIPYRNSKLTRILQSSLSGRALVAMVCCVSPSSANLEETISTLKFATRAKKIKAAIKINYDEQTLLAQYQIEIERLKSELEDAHKVAEERAAEAAANATKAAEAAAAAKGEERKGGGELKEGGLSERGDGSGSGDAGDKDQVMDEKDIEARIRQLTRIILKSSKAKAAAKGKPVVVSDVIKKTYKKGRISYAEFAHIQKVMQRAQATSDTTTSLLLGFSVPKNVKKGSIFSWRGADKETKKQLEMASEVVERMKEQIRMQQNEVLQLRERVSKLEKEVANKDEALKEWDLFYQNLQNKQPPAENVAAQLLALECAREEDVLRFSGEIQDLESTVYDLREQLKEARRGKSAGDAKSGGDGDAKHVK